MPVNHFFTTKPIAITDTPLEFGSNFRAGAGVILSDPYSPSIAPHSPFLKAATTAHSPVDLAPVSEHLVKIVDIEDIDEFSKEIYISFKASLGFGSLNAAYSYTRKRRETYRSLLVILRKTVATESIQNPEWHTPPITEEKTDWTDERLRELFVLNYGSHFTKSIVAGYSFSTLVELYTLSDTEREAFSGAVNAWGNSWGASVEARQETTKTIKKYKLSVSSVVNAASVQVKNDADQFEDRDKIIGGLEETNRFIDDINGGRVRIVPGAMQAELQSYWSTLASFERTQSVLTEYVGQVSTAPYGIPRGTIIAWYPQADSLVGDTKSPTYECPDGWAVCNGDNGTPDLRDKFIRGGDRLPILGASGGGGSETHTHSGLAQARSPTNQPEIYRRVGATRIYAAQAAHTHDLAIAESNHVPPYHTLIFIMKL